MAKPELKTKYLGLNLCNPIVASASPLTGKLDSLIAIQEAGAGAVVLPSLFEEQIARAELELAHLYDYQSDLSSESLSYFPELDTYNSGPDRYLDLIRSAKRELQIPVIASLNGASAGGWLQYATRMEEAGADALELNIYTIPESCQTDAAKVEAEYCKLVTSIRSRVSLPIAVKIGPYFSSIPAMAKSLVDAGAMGLVLFNRYLAPDIDLDRLEFKPALELSRPSEVRLALRWIAILRDQLPATSLAATGGIHHAEDVIKALLVGADATMVASALLQQGIGRIKQLKAGLLEWLTEHDYDSVDQLRGSMSSQNSSNPEGLLRANYLHALTSYTNQELI